MPTEPVWGRFEELRPDDLLALVEQTPVAYWPLGLLEHHGWALPVGFDGLKAQRLCERLARRTGGVVLPVMWWGSDGGHAAFHWTLYQDPEVAALTAARTIRGLIGFGFRAVVLLAGHYPWDGILDRVLPSVQTEHPETLILWGSEATVGRPDHRLPGDHAARWETSYGLALLPELVDMDALRPGRDRGAWPAAGPPPEAGRHPGVVFDPADPLFAQYGEDGRTASADEGERRLAELEEHLTGRVVSHLSAGRRSSS